MLQGNGLDRTESIWYLLGSDVVKGNGQMQDDAVRLAERGGGDQTPGDEMYQTGEWNPARVRQLLTRLNWSTVRLAAELECAQATVEKWLAGSNKPLRVYCVQLDRLWSDASKLLGRSTDRIGTDHGAGQE